ncbi:MAG: bifunctional riboflavin kinase/FAD synthetase [Desulfarculus sp.]|nr:bifunctional riboflavin kinase/FAD synthetase [Pseudomonadota bacterium]MBV1714756.1 bifunctional riboflavin kinase/FAD synthetase [Desulfarculus sp.]MBU4575082.1 bifunctional riboflavin kinase/FAD synthetase [Pseudomonadota bacterium]MBU4600297.1 bifunctional riboflavin kinase/FAD synthetase [Pseudomonadota bacterium]MBV1740244.1 bifunctional riboflavin kinase/FAD synthetase [Desulfarculus sp.]
MQVVMGLEELRERLRRPVITIGNFDGVHLGHQALFAKAVERAQAVEGTALAVTFEPHPIRVLRPAVNLPLITPLEQKLELMGQHGLDMTLCLRFDQDFARLSADAFVDKLLVSRLGAAEVVVGYDFAFGHKGLGDLDLLRSKGEQWGFKVHVVGPVIIDDRPVSSTRVRQEVADGNMDAARRLLGRHYQVAGRVVAGHGRGGRLLGFPTANLRVSDELLPGPGVYAVLVEMVDGRFLKGANNIGNNPTFDDGALSVETHLLDFDGDLYGQDIRLHFVERLRGEKRFESAEELKTQIGLDIARAIEILDPWARAGNGKGA